jgi:hypothetical protein
VRISRLVQPLQGLLLAGALLLAGVAAAHEHAMPAASQELGMSAAPDSAGTWWSVGKQERYLVLRSSQDGGATWSAPRRIQPTPEGVAANGEDRPQIAFGPKGEIYVSYTRPLAKAYAGEIRLVRSLDGGQSFLPPVTVHANRDVITHRFNSMIVDRAGRLYVAWIDKRDLESAKRARREYEGAAVYYAVSDDSGASFHGDVKLAEHSCECCRIALALGADGVPVAMWRHVFAGNARDHALARLAPDGKPAAFERATFDDWRIEACPHHGPALAFGPDGRRHQVWFNLRNGEGGVFYASTDAAGKLGEPRRLGSGMASHADVAVRGQQVALAWQQFDGHATTIEARVSADGGKSWSDTTLGSTAGAADQPHLVATAGAIYLVWNSANEGVRIIDVNRGSK